MSISGEPTGAGPAVALARVRSEVAELGELLWASRSDDEVVEVVSQVARLTATLAVVEAAAVAEVEARGLAKKRLHFGSTGDWLTHLGGLRRGEGKRLVGRAVALCGALEQTNTAVVA